MHNRKAHIPFLSHLVFFFIANIPFTCTPIFNRPEKSNVFKGLLTLWVQRCILIPQELAVNCALVFDPVAQLFVFPAFQVHSSSMSMLKINEILEILIQKFVVVVYFI